jgi:hypothetical protein
MFDSAVRGVQSCVVSWRGSFQGRRSGRLIKTSLSLRPEPAGQCFHISQESLVLSRYSPCCGVSQRLNHESGRGTDGRVRTAVAQVNDVHHSKVTTLNSLLGTIVPFREMSVSRSDCGVTSCGSGFEPTICLSSCSVRFCFTEGRKLHITEDSRNRIQGHVRTTNRIHGHVRTTNRIH